MRSWWLRIGYMYPQPNSPDRSGPLAAKQSRASVCGYVFV